MQIQKKSRKYKKTWITHTTNNQKYKQVINISITQTAGQKKTLWFFCTASRNNKRCEWKIWHVAFSMEMSQCHIITGRGNAIFNNLPYFIDVATLTMMNSVSP